MNMLLNQLLPVRGKKTIRQEFSLSSFVVNRQEIEHQQQYTEKWAISALALEIVASLEETRLQDHIEHVTKANQ